MVEYENIGKMITSNINLIDLFYNASILVQIVVVILAILSVYSWSIIFTKIMQLRYQIRHLDNFITIYYTRHSPHYRKITKLLHIFKNDNKAPMIFKILLSGIKMTKRDEHGQYKKIKEDNIIYSSMYSTYSDEVISLEKNINILATISSSSPFIGLLGTVWGIMKSFQSFSSNSGIGDIAPGIAEALFATAIGLIAAIPASIFYNQFVNQVNYIKSATSTFIEDFISVIGD